MIRLEVKDGEFNLADYIYDDSNNQHPKYHSAALVKWRDITLWRMLYDMYNTISLYYRVVYNLRAPSVAVLRAGEIDGIAALHFSHEDAIA